MTDVADRVPEVPVGITRAKAPEPVIADRSITGDRYHSVEFARREWEHMWTKVWLVAGRVDQLPKPGDYITYEIGSESILVSRGADQRLRAFYNVCQHRGNRLVAAERGSAPGGTFQCAYHGWRFADTGELKWVYCEEDFPQGNPCGKRNLVEIPCDTWAGFVWINMDEGCDSLASFLSPVAEQLDCYQMETMKRTHWVTLHGEFNWKCVQDNFNESYHLPYVHPQILASMDELYSACQFDLYPSGHCRMIMPGGGPGPQFKGKPDRVLQRMGNDFAYWDFDPTPYRDNLPGIRVAMQQRKRELAESKGFDFSRYSDEQLTDNFHYTLFPNVSFSMKPDGCIFLMSRPRLDDPSKCVFDMWYLTKFPAGVTEYHANSMGDWVSIDHQVDHVVGKAGEVSCGPGIDQDVAIWNTQQKGLTSRGYRGDYMPDQERRIRYFHQNLDAYIERGEHG